MGVAGPVEPALEPRLESLGVLVRRAARRALGALLVVGVLALFGGERPGWAFVAQALLGASGLFALAVLARPVSHRLLRAGARVLTLGFVAPAWALATYVAGDQLRALGSTGDLGAGWAAAQAAVQRLSHASSSAEVVLIVSVATGANLATVAFSGERDCGPSLLLPVPALLLLVGFGHAGSIPLALFGALALAVFFCMMFHVVERPKPRLLSGARRDDDDAAL